MRNEGTNKRAATTVAQWKIFAFSLQHLIAAVAAGVNL
jgi:hypothetical protein